LGIVLVATQIHPFLALTEHTATNILVVEGWLTPHAFKGAAKEYRWGSYELIFTTGGPAPGSGGYTDDQNTMAALAAGALAREGILANRIHAVPSRVIVRNRTYGSAVALRNWLRENRPDISSLNIVSEDAHARRTRLLFEQALGRNIRVGVISIPNADYDASRWWRTSDGVQEVLNETLAYLYARFLFFPTDAETAGLTNPSR